MKTKNLKTKLLSAVLAGLALFGATTERAQAQEIELTGPLAGAPAVRKLKLYRQGRFEIDPAISFSLLDQYQRTIFLGARLNYNFTDWLGFGAWGAYGGLLQITTHLTDQVQDVNVARRKDPNFATSTGGRLTAVNMSKNFPDQLGGIDWVVAPQLTAVPFRGKLALFTSIYVDTDFYVFAGPAIVGISDRANCKRGACTTDASFDTASRVAVAPTMGLGFTFYVNKWSAIGFEWRGLPLSINNGGFDTAGGGKDKKFPDDQITADDRRFNFNQLLTLSYNIYLPTQYRVSE